MLSLNELTFCACRASGRTGGAEWDMAGSGRHDRLSHQMANASHVVR
jgi:hypothetical protein